MKTPYYEDEVVIGGTSQTTKFEAFPERLLNRQSGRLRIICKDENSYDYDISDLNGTDAKVKPYGSAETPVTLGTGVVKYTPERFTLRSASTPATAGNFTLTVAGETTGNIAYNATAETIQTALEALASRSSGDFEVIQATGLNLGESGASVVVNLSGGFALTASSSITTSGLTGNAHTLTTNRVQSVIQNMYEVTWVRDKIPAGWSTYPTSFGTGEGTIVLWIECEETGTADFFQLFDRFNIEDGNFNNSADTLPELGLIFYYNPTFQYSNTTTDADPTSGYFRFDNTTLASVTEMYISDTPQQGMDLQTLIQNAGVGSHIFIGNPNVKLEGAYFTVSGAITNNTNYSTVPLTYVDAGTSQFTNGNIFSFTIDTVGLTNSFADGTSINDNNSNEIIEFGVTTSAVNHVKVTNQATGNGPKIESAGDDSDINLEIDAKGTGTINLLKPTVLSDSLTLGGTLNTNSKQVRLSKGADVASASALTLGTDGNYFDITGTTAITSIDTLAVGTVVTLHFDDALTLTHHATDLILPGGANITTAAGDEFTFVEYATGDWRCIGYVLASGEAITSDPGGGGDPFGETTVNTHSAGDTILVSEYDESGSGEGTCTVTNRFTDSTAGTVSMADSDNLTAGDKCYLENGGTAAVTWDFTNASDYFNYNSNLVSVSQAVGDARILATYLGSNIWRFE